MAITALFAKSPVAEADALPSLTSAAPVRKNWFVRMLDAVAKSRMRQVERDINRYRHLLPHELENAGYRISYKNDDALPFVR